MKRTTLLFLLAVVIYSCQKPSEQQSESTDTTKQAPKASLNKVWETDTILTTSESVLLDEGNGILYVSNIDGQPTEKDGAGFISKMKPDGAIEELEWVSGLNAPKGMAILDGKLYVTDIDELVEINLQNGQVSNKFAVTDAKFLNDVATDGEHVYFSDSRTGTVYVLENNQVRPVLENLNNVNGLAFNDQGELFALSKNGLQKLSMENQEHQMINDKVVGGDGLIILDDSTFIASRWQGEIYLVANGKEQLLLDTKSNNSNTADIEFIPEENLVLVPTFKANRVVAYRLDY